MTTDIYCIFSINCSKLVDTFKTVFTVVGFQAVFVIAISTPFCPRISLRLKKKYFYRLFQDLNQMNVCLIVGNCLTSSLEHINSICSFSQYCPCNWIKANALDSPELRFQEIGELIRLLERYFVIVTFPLGKEITGALLGQSGSQTNGLISTSYTAVSTTSFVYVKHFPIIFPAQPTDSVTRPTHSHPTTAVYECTV